MRTLRSFKCKLILILVLLGTTISLPNHHANDTFTEPLIESWIFPIQAMVHYGEPTMDVVSCHIDRYHVSTDHVVINSRFYSQKSPGMTWAGMLPYWLLTRVNGNEMTALTITAKFLAIVVVLIPLLIVLYFWGFWLRDQIGERWSLLTVVIALTASPLYAYAGMFVDYSLGTATILGVFLLLKRGGILPLLFAGLGVGVGLLLNYWVGFLCLLVFGMHAVQAARLNGALYRFVAISAIVLAAVILMKLFGAPTLGAITMGYVIMTIIAGLQWYGSREEWIQVLFMTLLGMLIPIGAFLIYNTLMWGDPYAQSYDFLLPHAQALHDNMAITSNSLWESLVGWRRGMFMHVWWAPVALIALIVVAKKNLQMRWTALTALGITAGTYLFQAYYTSTNNDVLPFSRHMVPVWPWLALGLILGIRLLNQSETKRWIKSLGKGLIGGLIGVASLLPFMASWTYPMQTDFPKNQMGNIWMEFFLSGDHVPITHVAQLFDRHDVPGIEAWRAGGQWTTIAICAILIVGTYVLAVTHKSHIKEG